MQRIKRRWLVWLISFAALALVLAGCGNDDADEGENEDQVGQDMEATQPLDTSSNKVIASYEGLTSGEVTEGEFNLSLNVLTVMNPQVAMLLSQPEFKDELLTQYIAQKSISESVELSDALTDEVDQLVDGFKSQVEQTLPEDQDFAAFVEEKGFSEEDLRNFVVDNMKVEQHFTDAITDQDLAEAYDELKEEKDLRLYSAKIRHILIEMNEERDEEEAKKRAEEVKQKLDEGGDFATLAEEYSDDGSKENGGLLGEEPQPLAGYVPEFAEAARDLPLDEISDPVQSQFGFHIIKVEQREQLALDDVKEIVQGDLMNERYQYYVDNDLKIDTENL